MEPDTPKAQNRTLVMFHVLFIERYYTKWKETHPIYHRQSNLCQTI